MLYKISEFSKLTKISTRMLRYLDHEGVLKPKLVDDNGYRYYSEIEMERAGKINRLRRYHFTYQEIKDILDRHLEHDSSLYKQKLESLKEVIQDYEVLVNEIEGLFLNDEVPIANAYNILIHTSKPHYILSKRVQIPNDALESFIEKSVEDIHKKCQGALLGSYYLCFFGDELLEDTKVAEAEYDVCFIQPVVENLEIEGFETVFRQTEIVLSTLHYGSYDLIYHAYLSLFAYIQQEGYMSKGPYSEKYFVDRYFTTNPNEYITEVSIIVSKRT